jgi:hypothetical protein
MKPFLPPVTIRNWKNCPILLNDKISTSRKPPFKYSFFSKSMNYKNEIARKAVQVACQKWTPTLTARFALQVPEKKELAQRAD